VAQFVLVHGSFQGAWCWRELIPRLENLGHRAVAFDLPAHGADQTSVETVNLADYVDATVRVLDASDPPAILVGHSMGAPISGASEKRPSAVAALVFVAGLLPPNGASMLESVAGFDEQYLAEIVWAPDRRSASVSETGARRFLFPLCPTEAVDQAVRLTTPEPIAPYETPIVTTENGFGSVPRYYIETSHDRVVPLAMQKTIQARIGCRRTLSIDSDHSPFFSAPNELVDALNAIAADL
jgi:pimeloyl-ACP methyl ester carboxylesterase